MNIDDFDYEIIPEQHLADINLVKSILCDISVDEIIDTHIRYILSVIVGSDGLLKSLSPQTLSYMYNKSDYFKNRAENKSKIKFITISPTTMANTICLRFSVLNKLNKIYELFLDISKFLPKTDIPTSLLIKLMSYVSVYYTAYDLDYIVYDHIDTDSLLLEAIELASKVIKNKDWTLYEEMFPAELIEHAHLTFSENIKVERYPVLLNANPDGSGVLCDTSISSEDIDIISYKKNATSELISKKIYFLFALNLLTQKTLAIDFETSGLDPFTCNIVSTNLSWNTHFGFYLSNNHIKEKILEDPLRRCFKYEYTDEWKSLDNTQNLSGDIFKKILKVLQQSKLIYHNAKFDTKMASMNQGINLPIYFDTMIAHYLLNPGSVDGTKIQGSEGFAPSHSLKVIAPKELKISKWKIDIIHCQDRYKEVVGMYGVKDSCYTYALFAKWLNKMSENRIFFDVEIPYISCLAEVELNGIDVDKEHFAATKKDFLETIKDIKTEVDDLACEVDFPLDSNPRLGKLLFEKLKIRPKMKCHSCSHEYRKNIKDLPDKEVFENWERKCPNCGSTKETAVLFATPSGKPSLNKLALKDMALDGIPIAQKILQYRGSMKLLNTYLNLPEKLHPITGKIHCSYNQVRVATGRLSSYDPNFQNIPKTNGIVIREGIIPPPGYTLVACDYSGQETTIMAAYSRDPRLIRAYNPCHGCEHNPDGLYLKKGNCPHEDKTPGSYCDYKEVHSYITSLVYADTLGDVPLSIIKKEHGKERGRCKAVTFSLAYGGSAYGIAMKNNMPIEEAEEIVRKYFETFPGVAAYLENTKKFVMREGYVVDAFGRKRYFDLCGYNIAGRENNFYRYVDQDLQELVYRPIKEYRKQVNAELRAAVNAPIQGTGATMTKLGGIKLKNIIHEHDIDAIVLGYVHDEIISAVRTDKQLIREYINILESSMIDLDLSKYCVPNGLNFEWPDYLPITVGTKLGNNWGSMMNPEKYIAENL